MGVSLGASSSLCSSGLVFQRLVLLSVPQARDNLINAIGWKRNVGRAQSKASNKDVNLFQVRQRAAPTLQSSDEVC